MSVTIAKFFRNIPCESLQAYFGSYPSKISEAVNWNEPPKNVASPLLKAVDELDDDEDHALSGYLRNMLPEAIL
jgi:hypothetical protein